MIKKINLGFVGILFTFLLFGLLVPRTFAQAADVYIGLEFEKIYNPSAADPDNAALLPDTTITYANDGADDVITLTEEKTAGDTVWSSLITLTSGNDYSITIHPKVIDVTNEPTSADDYRIYSHLIYATYYCECLGGEYVSYTQEIFERCDTCPICGDGTDETCDTSCSAGQDCCDCFECCTCKAWPGGSFNCATDGGVAISEADCTMKDTMSCSEWSTAGKPQKTACGYECGANTGSYRIGSVTCKKFITDLNFSMTYTE